jgi:hypothetical protein
VEAVGVDRLGDPSYGGFAQVDYCTIGGDSGGPVYSLGKARGVHVGHVLGDPACQNRLYQGAAEAAARLNVYVVTT